MDLQVLSAPFTPDYAAPTHRITRPLATVDHPLEGTEGISLVIPSYYNAYLKADSVAHVLAGLDRSRHIREIVLVRADDAPLPLRPWLTPRYGPLELAKVARGQLLWGDSSEYDLWAQAVLTSATQHGLLIWLTVCIGLRTMGSKVDGFFDRYTAAVDGIISFSDGPAARPDSLTRHEECASLALSLLAATTPDWQARVKTGVPLWECQGPESWRGLQWLAAHAE